MTKQNCGVGRDANRFDKDRIENMSCVGNRKAGCTLVDARGNAAAFRPSESAVAENHEPADA
jgi:hypothetical protein